MGAGTRVQEHSSGYHGSFERTSTWTPVREVISEFTMVEVEMPNGYHDFIALGAGYCGVGLGCGLPGPRESGLDFVTLQAWHFLLAGLSRRIGEKGPNGHVSAHGRPFQAVLPGGLTEREWQGQDWSSVVET